MTVLPKKAIALAGLSLIAASAFGQSNTVPGRNVKLNSLNSFTWLNRTGTFPNGLNAAAESTTSCNVGTSNLPWQQPMDPDHPLIAFVIARESNGRFEQISDRSFVKHGFFATNSNGCGTCQNPFTSALLGINCSDTYSATNNGDNFYLAPADEINPWFGTWNPTCSHFDMGEPPVAPAQQCDGLRSFSSTQANNLGPIGHRVQLLDADLNVGGANYYYQGLYLTQGEAESLRSDNMSWRKFTPTWSVAQNKWTFATVGAQTYNSVLSAWTGATVNSNTNGADDGRFYVGVKVTGPVNGVYHYEYAVHNRDNQRGASALRIPTCNAASFSTPWFGDVDSDGGNDWISAKGGAEISFSTPNNPLKWNTIFSFAFDSTAAPVSGTVQLDQFLAGAGAASVGVASLVPGGEFNVYLGPGCGSPSVPNLVATGAPAQATLGNATFGLETSNVAPGSTVLLWGSLLDGTLQANPSCAFYMNVAGLFLQVPLTADGFGLAALPLPIPNDPLAEGVHVNFQAIEVESGGALANQANLSNGLRVRIGNAISPCQ